MKTLGGITLPNQTLWTNKYAWLPVHNEVTRSIAGNNVVWNTSLIKGRPITLVLQEDAATIEKVTLDALFTLASQVGEVYTLGWDGEAYNVQFMSTDGQNAFDVQPIWPTWDIFTGTIHLLEV